MPLTTALPKIKTPPTANFLAVVFAANQTSQSAQCELCGRTHFNESHRATAAGLHDAIEAQPQLYVAWPDEVRHATFNGQSVVRDCPCNKLSAFESFVWENRRLIAEYIAIVARQRLQEADEEAEVATQLVHDATEIK